MKVLQINVYHYRKGGSEAVYFNTSNLLIEHGHTVINFALKWNENIPCSQSMYFPLSKDLRKGITGKIKNLIAYFKNKDAAKKLDLLLTNEKPDIAHIHLIWGQLSGAILPVLLKHKIPIVFSIHDYRIVCPAYTFKDGKGNICEDCKGKYFYKCFTKRCTKGNYFMSFVMSAEQYYRNKYFNPSKFINGLIYVSDFAKSIHEKYLPSLKLKENIILYNSTDKLYESPNTIDEKYFLFYGRLSFEKGVMTLIKAIEPLTNIKLKIVGTGPLENELKNYVSQKHLNNIEFLGYKSGDELHHLVRYAYFIIVPSEWYENNPLTIIEGYSASTPVIGSRIGGIPEIIIDGKTGFLFEHKNVTMLRNVIKKAFSLSPDEYIKFREASLLFAKEKFNPSLYYPQLIEFYRTIIDKYNNQ